MNNLKQILWTDPNSAPPKNYLWQKKDGIYTFINGSWKRTKIFQDADWYCDDGEIPFIAKLTEGEYIRMDDVPESKGSGLHEGWSKPSKYEKIDSFEKCYSEKGNVIYYNAVYITIDV